MLAQGLGRYDWQLPLKSQGWNGVPGVCEMYTASGRTGVPTKRASATGAWRFSTLKAVIAEGSSLLVIENRVVIIPPAGNIKSGEMKKTML